MSGWNWLLLAVVAVGSYALGDATHWISLHARPSYSGPWTVERAMDQANELHRHWLECEERNAARIDQSAAWWIPPTPWRIASR